MNIRGRLPRLLGVTLSLASVLQAQAPLTTLISDAQLARDSKEYGEFDNGSTIEEVVASGKSFDSTHNTFIVAYQPHEEIMPPWIQDLDPLAEFKTLTYNSELIIIGTPTGHRSAPTASHKFVFSDYAVRIDAVVKDSKSTYSKGQSIVVTRPAGEVTVGGFKLKAIEPEFPLFRTGEQYIFFLHKVSDSDSLKVGPSGVFLIKDGNVSSGRVHPRVDTSKATLASILNEIIVASAPDRGLQDEANGPSR